MMRQFLVDRGRHAKGDINDYPLQTWRSFFPDYEKITKQVGMFRRVGNEIKRTAEGDERIGDDVADLLRRIETLEAAVESLLGEAGPRTTAKRAGKKAAREALS